MDRRALIATLLVVGAAVLVLVLRGRPGDGFMAEGELLAPELLETWDGVRTFLVEPEQGYLIPVQCVPANPSFGALKDALAEPGGAVFDLVENPEATKGVRSRVVRARLEDATRRVWQVHGGEVIRPLELGELSRSEVLKHYNSELEESQSPLEAADLKRTELAVKALRLEVALYLPKDLANLGRMREMIEKDGERIFYSRQGQNVSYTAPSLPGSKISLGYSPTRDARYVVRVGKSGGEC